MLRTLLLAAFCGLFSCNYIVLRYTVNAGERIPDSEYVALAELRYRIQFLHGSNIAAEPACLEPADGPTVVYFVRHWRYAGP
jgi:hypothetical protein